eukprot:TRINITY_DN4054_c0_g1_i2.p1 TRINITY_DN4054_c0_g1~~TRINITY_DN4054_c0_g1_i2.p1  ORF type:complete len:734 (-),score=213.97 TRINITY_DN4054_c0_g1_i2:403-2538(-)
MGESMRSSLLKWINTFKTSHECTSFTDLCDGVVLYEVMCEISPTYFDETQVNKDAQDNWVLRLSNLRKLATTLESYYREELGISPKNVRDVSFNAIAKNHSIDEVAKLVDLVLGAAVECDEKEKYITNIMTLGPKEQRDLMQSIQSIMTYHRSQLSQAPSDPFDDAPSTSDSKGQAAGSLGDSAVRDELSRVQEELRVIRLENSTAMQEKEGLVQMVTRLEKQLAESEETIERAKKESLEREQLRGEEASAATPDPHHLARIREMEEELYRREDELKQVQRKADEGAKVSKENRRLKDEMDIMRESLGEAEESQNRLVTLTKTLRNQDELKALLKAAENQSEEYMKQKLDLEDQLEKMPRLKSRLSEYKNQISDLKSQLSTALGAKDALERTVAKEETRTRELQAELGEMHERTVRLDAELSEVRSSAGGDSASFSSLQDSSAEGESLSSFTEVVTPEMKEKIARLERENKRFKQTGGQDQQERIDELENELDDIKRLNAKLEERIGEDPVESDQFVGSEQHALLTTEHEELQRKARELEKENKRMAAAVDTEAARNLDQETTTSEEIEALKEKITTLEADKTKLDSYLRTAKTMIRDQRLKQKQQAQVATQQGTSDEQLKHSYDQAVASLEQQLREKDETIASMKSRYDQNSLQSESEQKLLVSAFYEMGLNMQRMKAPKATLNQSFDPDREPAKPTSFLGLKRMQQARR